MESSLDLTELTSWVGQLFMAGLPGPELDPDTRALIRERGLGGIILFSRNVRDPVQVARVCTALQDTALEARGRPLLLAVDQEGGRVARLRRPFTEFAGNAALATSPRPEAAAEAFARVTAREMSMVGLNMNLAPVLDVSRGPLQAHLEQRLFGSDPDAVSRLGSIVIQGLQEGGVMAVAKHFPGLGRAPVDPHHELPRIEAMEEEMAGVDLKPFQRAVREGVAGIMTSHAVYPCYDPELPATLSRRIVTGILREKLGFGGLVLSDDLEMGAIRSRWGVAKGAALAFEAGVDCLLVCQSQEALVEAMDHLRSQLLDGSISPARLRESLTRHRTARDRFLSPAPQISLDRVASYFKQGGNRELG